MRIRVIAVTPLLQHPLPPRRNRSLSRHSQATHLEVKTHDSSDAQLHVGVDPSHVTQVSRGKRTWSLVHLESMPRAEAGPEPEPDERRKNVDRSGMSGASGWVGYWEARVLRRGGDGLRRCGGKGPKRNVRGAVGVVKSVWGLRITLRRQAWSWDE